MLLNGSSGHQIGGLFLWHESLLAIVIDLHIGYI